MARRWRQHELLRSAPVEREAPANHQDIVVVAEWLGGGVYAQAIRPELGLAYRRSLAATFIGPPPPGRGSTYPVQEGGN